MNAVRCLTCGIIIESTHRHDFKSCKCQSHTTRVSVDGGSDYNRRVFGNEAKWDEIININKISGVIEYDTKSTPKAKHHE